MALGKGHWSSACLEVPDLVPRPIKKKKKRYNLKNKLSCKFKKEKEFTQRRNISEWYRGETMSIYK